MAGISVSAGSPPFYREISLGHDKKVRNGSLKGCRFCCLLGQLFLPFIAGAPDSHLLRIFNQFITELRMSDGDQFFCSLPGG